MGSDEIPIGRAIVRVTWRDTHHIVVDYDSGEVELRSGCHQLAEDIAECEGLIPVRAPDGGSEWHRDSASPRPSS